MPLTGNISKDIKELKDANKNKPAGKKRSLKQILAIALSQKNKRK